MLTSQLTFEDFLLIYILTSNMICLYAGRRWGLDEGYQRGARHDRLAKRTTRRLFG